MTSGTALFTMSRQSNDRGPKTLNTDGHGRPQSKDGEAKGMWSSLLDSVASGKKLPEKNLVVLGRSQWRDWTRA